MLFSAISEDIIKDVNVSLKKLLRKIMELLLTVLMLAPIGILIWNDKDTFKCKISSAKKCLLHIVLIFILPLAVLILRSRRGIYLLEIPDTIISILESYAVYQIGFFVMAIIIKFGIQNDCNNCSEKDKASISDETGNNKFIAMLVAVLVVLAFIAGGIISSMSK